MSVSDTVIAKLAARSEQIRRLQSRVARLERSRATWRQRHADCRHENARLSRRLRELERPARRPCEPSLRLSTADLDRIISIPPR